MKARVFNIMQYERHPVTGEELINEHQIQVALAHKSIKKWAYICHDRDVYSARDEAESPLDDDGNKLHIMGQPKPPHWHIVCQSERAVELDVIARWFGIPANFVDAPQGRSGYFRDEKGHGKFMDCVEYLTHEAQKQRELGKTYYPDEKVSANFDFRAELDKRAARKGSDGRNLDEAEWMIYQVRECGMSLRAACDMNIELFHRYNAQLKSARAIYLQYKAPRPKARMCVYIWGKGGTGKDIQATTMGRMYGRFFAAMAGVDVQSIPDKELVFRVGATNVTYEGYDGQPVVHWRDFRPDKLVAACGGLGSFLDTFDSFPDDANVQNIKGGSVTLTNAVNIITGQLPPEEFFKKIIGKEDVRQIKRRIQILIAVREDDFDISFNRGFMEDNFQLFDEYEAFKTIRGNMARVAEVCRGNEQLLQKHCEKMALPTVEKSLERYEAQQSGDVDEAEVEALLAGYGEEIVPVSGAAELPFPEASTGNEE